MQRGKLRRLLPFIVVTISFGWSDPNRGFRFIPIYEPLIIKAQKNSPPHVAFEELMASQIESRDWDTIKNVKPSDLALLKNSGPLFTKKIQLPEMAITKNMDRDFESQKKNQIAEVESNNWLKQLSHNQALRLKEAQNKDEVLDQDWSSPTWSDMAREVLEKSGSLTDNSATKSKVFVAGTSLEGSRQLDVPRSSVHFPGSGTQNQQSGLEIKNQDSYSFAPIAGKILSISGHLEINGGLGLTNDHHIEIRRSDEGVLKELGRADLKQGQYNIDVENTSGTVIARLVDKYGRILGEDSFRLARLLSMEKKNFQGPKLNIVPRPNFNGIVTGAYSTRPDNPAPSMTKATFVKGVAEVDAKRDGTISMDNIAKGSNTVLRVAAPKHLQTAAIVGSGQDFKAQLFPISMIQALEDIVGTQRALTFEGPPTVIWGKVSLDGKDLSGIDVILESDSSQQAVYFNQFLLPDPGLKSTSENGIFAFVNVTPGFHSLLATRSESIIGYQNVVVELGSVAQGDINSTVKSDSVPLRVFDAFTGESQASTVTIQSLQNDIETGPEDKIAVTLPQLSRMGLLRAQPHSSDYALAQYLYNDNDDFIHIPLININWLRTLKSQLRIDDHPSSGIVVGFVTDEDFEVFLAGYEKFEQQNIVYFDMQGRIQTNKSGVAGGGFILYNVPEDTHEVVVIGGRSQKVYSRVLPVDANTISVLNYRE